VSGTDAERPPGRGEEQASPEDAAQEGGLAAPPATWAGRERSHTAEENEQGEKTEAGDGEAKPPPDGLEGAELEEELADDEQDAEDLAEELRGNGGAPAPDEDTVEADTPLLADREAAREAALAGLRARTAEHAARRGVAASEEAAGIQAPAEAEAPAPGGPPAEAPAAAPDAERAPPAKSAPPPAAPAGDERPPGRALWARFLAGSLLIVVAMTTATAVSLLVYLKGIARGLGGLPSVRNQLEVADPGHPQTILILGSDKRPQGQEVAHSDTSILLRVAADQITVMSIPRDLKVNIPGHGIDKFNTAYTYGGPKLTLKVVKQLTGIQDINHVVNVDFTGFADAVNAIDCVYVDVDHHYYNSNAGLALSAQYAEIDIPAGYQRMCGYNALQYVRYRHDDNDLVRAARQQEFLREARQELPASKLLSDRNELIEILKKYVTSDIEDETTLVSLGKIFLAARHAPVVQIHFPANLGGPTAAYVTASESAIRQAVARFEGDTPPPPQEPVGGSGQKNQGKNRSGGPSKPAPPPLEDATASGRQHAGNLASSKTKSGRPMLDFPIYYPTKLAPGSTLIDDSRAFPIDGPGNDVYRGYKLVAEAPTDGYTAYYGVSGTDWKDPPILANPDQTKTIDGRDYLMSWDGGRLRVLGWKTDHGSYWIDNTLLNALTPGQMFGIAQSTRNYGR
jgi:LCP family protein required for cell wall assembly